MVAGICGWTKSLGEQLSCARLTAEGEQGEDNGRSNQDSDLRLAAGLSDDRGAWRAGIHRKGADQAGDQAAGADPDEIPIDIGRVVRIVRE